MIGLELKADTKTPSKLVLSSQDSQQDKLPSTLSFASLLSGITDQDKDLKLPQNGTLVLSLKDNVTEQNTKDTKHSSTASSILSLLKDEEIQTPKNEVKPLELNPQLTEDKTVSELKVIIKEAKQYLKNKIISLEGFKKSEIASLPKTLKGLVQVAQKFGIDVSKVTLEEVKQSITPKLPKEELKTIVKLEKDLEIKSEKVVKKAVQKNNEVELKEQPQVKQQVKTEEKPVQVQQTPLFKTQTKPVEITTQQLVNVKVGNEIDKTQKQKTQNTLELLLRGEKVRKNETNLTADFSVATARVIAPQAKTDADENLDSLLKGENVVHNHTEAKSDMHVQKTDSFEVKINEAKQMIKYLSQDVKQAIEEYKPPFTRVKVQLNPQKLGEIDLTVIQRGKNLHINLSSNNAAINTLAMNANDLKVQLNNSGIQNASLNFSNMSQGDQSGAGSHAHQQQHNRQNAQEEYGYFQNEDTNEEIVNSLEIVVPNYA
ncbi:flagellar hook-length control protein FliK [Sulfurimonas sp. C5]|uniref:flagellar hook-length control protein FliK n=1 Tax=Sulfurimonas sp. C5 TaxID=3036947 RepID=UPI0024550C22|nr:flagellar hook-length control protein FliK [Sulfurimonas sp. C5]MDH4944854.1 flagellar hook-length control protein FliK [Sulfurimonas sp. C5]